VQTLVGEAVETRFAQHRHTSAEILKPVHDAADASGMSQEELETLADQAVADARAKRNAEIRQLTEEFTRKVNELLDRVTSQRD
jgi:hypothetical protein